MNQFKDLKNLFSNALCWKKQILFSIVLGFFFSFIYITNFHHEKYEVSGLIKLGKVTNIESMQMENIEDPVQLIQRYKHKVTFSKDFVLTCIENSGSNASIKPNMPIKNLYKLDVLNGSKDIVILKVKHNSFSAAKTCSQAILSMIKQEHHNIYNDNVTYYANLLKNFGRFHEIPGGTKTKNDLDFISKLKIASLNEASFPFHETVLIDDWIFDGSSQTIKLISIFLLSQVLSLMCIVIFFWAKVFVQKNISRI